LNPQIVTIMTGTNNRLLFGPLSAALFFLGTIGVAYFLPGYSHIRQDVSEIGAFGTPTRLAFAVLCFIVASCVFIFATALRTIATSNALSTVPAYLTAFVALTEMGIGIFAMPHPFHEPIGLTALIGFQAPGILAYTWRKNPRMRPAIGPSWGFFIGMWVATVVILVPQHWPAAEAFLDPIGGLVQRTLFLAWFGWCALTGLLLRRICSTSAASRCKRTPD
jgi:hypothetical membrane protein